MAAGEVEYIPGRDVAVFDGGVVVPTGNKQITPAEVVAQIKSVVALPYLGKDADKIGMTLMEAALYSAAVKAADGDLDALEKLLNRILGKPLQTTVQATGTLQEFLDRVVRSDSAETNPLDD